MKKISIIKIIVVLLLIFFTAENSEAAARWVKLPDGTNIIYGDRTTTNNPDGSTTTTCTGSLLLICAEWKDPVNIPTGPWGFFIHDPIDQQTGVGYIGVEFEVNNPGEENFNLIFTADPSDHMYTDYDEWNSVINP